MSGQQVDVVVVGLGPGGESAAGRLAEAGLSVVGIDRRLVGGECPYYACVPTKMMVRAAHALGEARRVPELSGGSVVQPDWEPVARRIRDEATADWDDTAAVERLEKAGVRFVRGHARITGDRQVEVDGTTYVARRGVLLNTGTEPAVPPLDGLDPSTGTGQRSMPYWTNRDAVAVDTLPQSLAVLGGGPIGVELAQVFARFGVRVTVVQRSDRLLALEEPEASALVAEAMAADGVRVVTGAEASSVTWTDGMFRLKLPDEEVTADKLLVATGRRPNLGDIGLDAVGLDPDAKTIDTDERMRAGDGLWAVGDITGQGGYTHVSMYQAGVAVADILGDEGAAADYRAVPRVTFCDPEVGAVGMTERQAREAGLEVRTGLTERLGTRGWIHDGGGDGLVKLVEDGARGVLVGATSVGPMGGEVLSMLATAVHGEVPVDRLRSMIYAYPTFHRAVEDALRDLG
jgi:pyruvate/2-oxoglutarate dehydrogenase complex dihydrolipoamide dehydrogenase (E3) component